MFIWIKANNMDCSLFWRKNFEMDVFSKPLPFYIFKIKY